MWPILSEETPAIQITDVSGVYTHRELGRVNRCTRSVDSQDLRATRAAARATEIARIAGGRLYLDFEASSARDHGRCDVGCELGAANHAGRKRGAIEDHYGGGNEIAAYRSDDEARRQL